MRQQLELLSRGGNQRSISRVSVALHNGLTIREANRAAAAAIAEAAAQHEQTDRENAQPGDAVVGAVSGSGARLDRAAVHAVVAHAQRQNPDGWAVDPEDVIHAIDERYAETYARQGPEAAVEVLRSVWRHHRDAFMRARAQGAPLPVQARSAGMILAAEAFAARTRQHATATC